MTIKDQLSANLKDAMRAKDKARINVIRQIEAEIGLRRSAPGFTGAVDDELYLETILSYVKKMKKAQAEFEAAGERGRVHASKLAFEVEYLSQWLPAQVDEATTRDVVKRAIIELGVDDPKQVGRVIGHILKGSAGLDGGLVNRLVREELGA